MKKSILIVDDDRINLKILQLRLSQKGFGVATAQNGEEGLKQYQTAKPDLILLDVEMPEMNGFTFLLELRKLPGGDSVPVLVMTVHEQMEPIFKFNNVKDYMIKPLDLDLLFEKIVPFLKT